ncbi:MAG: AbrB/MazE/SpoVT family DNA-binding domain-containing protein [Deltaproteobacteria bacterium]|nr:AbrB/MazE/SpoVT family DNA-binding domain-containing protein [Deltaproteobacteria bacterium]
MLTTRISSKGQIVIPKTIRDRLKISAGAFFNIRLENENIVLTPEKATPIERLYNKFAGETILHELEKEHADEIARENCA